MNQRDKLIRILFAKFNILEMENKNLSRPLQDGNINKLRSAFVPIFVP